MSSDIDIEEHDLLDHPTIKTMFPDISNIKMEVDDEELPEYEEPYEMQDPMTMSDMDHDGGVMDNLQYLDASSIHEVSGNRIILGTKPKIERDPYAAKVVLKDWNFILRKHPFFCQECQTLFPTQNTIDAHTMVAHSLLVAVDEESYSPPANKARKSTTKSIAFDVVSRNKAVKSTSKSQYETDSESEEASYKEKRQYQAMMCEICLLVYTNLKYFKYHTIRNHGTTELQPRTVSHTGSCTLPKCTYHNNDRRGYNSHMHYHYPERFKMPYEKYLQMNGGLKINKTLVQSKASKEKKIVKEANVEKQDQYVSLVPKDYLFKCSRCTLHFLAACVARKHAVQCCNRNEDWLCKQCNRAFKYNDRRKHTLQHRVSTDFKVIVITKKVASMAMCKCKCGILFDDRTFLKEHADQCKPIPFQTCDLCNMKVDVTFVDKHMKMHNSGLKFVIVNWVDTSKEVVAEKRKMVLKGGIYYCGRCKLYGNKRGNYHLSGHCELIQSRRICKLCGLCFSMKAFPGHLTREHSKKFKLNDLVFYDINTLRKIAPPLPEWKKCEECKINFFGHTAWQKHKCFEEDNYKKCSKCNESFSDLAYKLHYPFHNYPPPPDPQIIKKTDNTIDNDIKGIMEKYKSMQSLWNIIYLCDICDIVSDSYDHVVEHCQNHFCQMESYGVKIEKCFPCNLIFDHESYARHAKLHLNNIKKSSFKILKFNYENLLSDAWLDLFKAISEEQKSHILAKSLYDSERGLRLYLEVDGSLNNTLYKCDTCKTVVDVYSIVSHVKDKDACSQQDRLECSECDLMFLEKTTLENHQRNHKSIRIILFNKQEDSALNEVLCNVPRKGNLKFNWCKDCGLLIPKNVFSKHILKHKTKRKVGYVAKKGQAKRFDVYKCRTCSSTLVNKVNVRRHNCLPKSQLYKCTICHLTLKKNGMVQHKNFHRLHPSFTPKNIKIIVFGKMDHDHIPNVAVKPKKNMFVYQCAKCSTCMVHKLTSKQHTCTTDTKSLTECPICKFCFRKRAYVYHQLAHMRYPALTAKDFILKIVNDNEEEASNKATTVYPAVVYKCACNLLFVSSSSIVQHMPKCGTDNRASTCPKCRLKFHADELELHSRECGATFLVGEITVRNKITDTQDLWIFKCAKCEIHFSTERGAKMHFVKGHKNSRAGNCAMCNILITKSRYSAHLKRFHSDSPYKIDSMNICTYSSISPMALRKLSIAKPSKASNTPKQILYKCTQCPLHFLTSRNLEYHYKNDLHKKKPFRCRHCALLFTMTGWKRHESVAHTRDDFDVLIVPDTLNDSSSRSNIPTPLRVPRANLATNSRIEDSRATASRSNAQLESLLLIYQCTVCRGNFMNLETTMTHMKGPHTTKLLECERCGLLFSQKSLTKHTRIHHSTVNYKLEDFTIRYINSARTRSISSAKHAPSSSDNRVSSSDVTDVKVTADDRCDAPKLFKCVPCDVYFTTYDMCCEHTTDHITFDSTEYISCKLCDLQFVCECIGAHMRAHRENTFNIDDAIIIEFLPSRVGPPTTSKYLASECLKSLISTTTDF